MSEEPASSTTSSTTSSTIPSEFRQIVCDFLNDLLTTFPEYKESLDVRVLNIISDNNAQSLEYLFGYVKQVYPERFFDILYKNEDIFTDTNKNTEFFPGIEFSEIWKMDDVSDNTRDTIWKYLQLVMFSVLETLNDQSSFGDTAKLFEAINEDELKTKIQESMEQMKELFGENGMGMNFDGAAEQGEGINLGDLPNADSVHEHLNELMGGKLGKLAAEIAEETAQEFDMDMNEEGDVSDVFQKLFKNPGKLMGLVNNISGKLDHKLKSGDINQADLMKEAGDLMNKMKNMPGMPNIEDLLKNMNIPKNKQGMAKQMMNQNMRTNGAKARLQRKLEERKQAQAQQAQAQRGSKRSRHKRSRHKQQQATQRSRHSQAILMEKHSRMVHLRREAE